MQKLLQTQPQSDLFKEEDDPTPKEHEHRIYGDDRASVWAVVDEEDYQWALQWKWSPKWSRGKTKCYLRRNGQEGSGTETRTRKTIWLHIEIMKRKDPNPPSPAHCLVDHRNGDGFDCRRQNLRWATKSQNCRNLNGSHPFDFLV